MASQKDKRAPGRASGNGRVENAKGNGIAPPSLAATGAGPKPPANEDAVTRPVERAAVIDIGSNSVRLAVGSRGKGGEVRLIAETRSPTRLAQGLDLSGRLDPTAMEASVDAVLRMLAEAKAHGATGVRVVATCAVREAENASRFVAMIKAETGRDVEVISGDEEGRLAYVGAARQFDLSKAWSAVIDIGGGSTELAIAHKGKVETIASIPVGAVRLTERFGGPERALQDHFNDMKQFIDGLLNKHLKHAHSAADVLVVTGGSATALGVMDLLSRHPGKVDPEDKVAVSRAVSGYAIERATVKDWSKRLREMSAKERLAVPGLSRDRSAVIVAGLVILHRAMKRLRCRKAIVSAGSIRDGVLHEMLSTMG
ncbi:MAG: Ppx/GppA phosphatase family protein [Phycisphaerales bacterium]|nr:Ppx/GppA phosphatase family protein [Phycisphaerales bacterium]